MNALSLFSGCGGMDLGLERAGITAVAHCEIDPKARQVLRRHWPDTPIVEDVRDVKACACPVRHDADHVGPELLEPEAGRPVSPAGGGSAPAGDRVGRCPDCGGFRVGRIDLVHGGFPCQDISVAGHRKGLDGARSGLWWEFHRILAELRPRWCVIENVAGLLSSNGGRDMGAILGALGDLGYGFAWRVLDARHFGVPQRRRRVFIVGHLGGRGGAQVLLEPEGVRGDPAPGREAGEELAGTLGGCSGSRGWAPDTDRMTFVPVTTGTVTTTWAKGPGNTQVEEGHVIPVAFNGFNGIDHQASTEVTPTIRGMAHGVGMPQVAVAAAVTERGRDGNLELELGEPEVYNSLRAGDGGSSRKQMVMVDLAVRRLTPRECERLMSFPDDWTRWADDGTEIADSHRYRMCGNGVVSNVAEWIGRRIVEADA